MPIGGAVMPQSIAARGQNPFPLVLQYRSVRMTEQDFFRLCRDNEDFLFELSAEGDLIIMTPPSPKTSWRNAIIVGDLAAWTKSDGTGVCFESSAMFSLPNGAKRAPDAAWMLKSRWDALTEEEQDGFGRFAPDFAVELRSRTDRVKHLKAKMAEYIANGARLGWLIDPLQHRVYIYRRDHEPEVLDDPASLSGEDVLHGFVFNVRQIW